MLLQAGHLVNRGEIRLTRDGEAHCCVVTDSPEPSPVEKFAAWELAGYLTGISGARIPVELCESKIPGNTVPIRLGLLNRRSTPSLLPSSDHFEILVRKKKITIQGQNPRAVLFGVYSFLEEIGWLWSYPIDEEQTVPLCPELKVKIGFREVTHRVPVRNLTLEPNIERDPHLLVRYIDWMAKNHFNGLGTRLDCDTSVEDSRFSDARVLPPLSGDAISEIKKRGIQIY